MASSVAVVLLVLGLIGVGSALIVLVRLLAELDEASGEHVYRLRRG